MDFSDLMKEVSSRFKLWLSYGDMNDYYSSKEDMQKEFLSCIQGQIGSDFVIMTREELDNKLISYHNSMEGYYEG